MTCNDTTDRVLRPSRRLQHILIKSSSPRPFVKHVRSERESDQRLVASSTIHELLYRPLRTNETRLLNLKKGTSDTDPIEIELLQNLDFTDLGAYDALSYHWGTERSGSPIHIVEDLAEGQTITFINQGVRRRKTGNSNAARTYFPYKGLYYALKRIRRHDHDVRLWVDAICIDQNNELEKSHQLGSMDRIYSQASSVLIWLGEANQKTTLAMRFAEQLLSEPERISEFINSGSHTNAWEALLYLLRLPWFSRRWIIQELILAKDAVVYCGSQTLHWIELKNTIAIVVDHWDTLRAKLERKAGNGVHYDTLNEVEGLHAKKLVDCFILCLKDKQSSSEVISRREPAQTLEYLVSSLAIFDNADPRDTIYALRNIAKDVDRMFDSMTLEYMGNLLDIYVGFIKRVIDQSGCIDMICRHWAAPKPSHDRGSTTHDVVLPTWIKRRDGFNQQIHSHSFVGLPGEGSYNACFNLRAQNSRFGLYSVNASHAQCSTQPQAASASTSLPMTEVLQRIRNDDLLSFESHLNPASTDANSTDLTHDPKSASEQTQFPLKLTPHTYKPSQIRERYSRSLLSNGHGIQTPSYFLAPEAYTYAPITQITQRGKDASLYVQAVKIGPLQTVSLVQGGVIPRDVFIELDCDQTFKQGLAVPDVAWRTLVAERGQDGRPVSALYALACNYVLGLRSPEADLDLKPLLAVTPMEQSTPFIKRVASVVWNRSFFTLYDAERRRYHGFGPSDIRTKDILCILYGCSVPCILRPCFDDAIGTYYKLIGEAYVYGIMDGDYISNLDEAELQRRTAEYRIL